jgi:hypothetical protein
MIVVIVGYQNCMNDSPNGSGAADKPSMCAQFKQLGLHRSGRALCPFKDLPEHKARQAGIHAVEKVAGGMSKTKAFEGIAEFA